MRHIHKMLYINGHDTQIDEQIYDHIKWFNENGYETGESCQGRKIRRGEISQLYIVFIRLNKKQKRILSKTCKKLNIELQPAYLSILYYPPGTNKLSIMNKCIGMRISIEGEENRVQLLNNVITQLEYLQLNNSSNKFKTIKKL